MKFGATLLVVGSLIASATAHMGLLYPTPRGGYGTKQYNGRFHVTSHSHSHSLSLFPHQQRYIYFLYDFIYHYFSVFTKKK